MHTIKRPYNVILGKLLTALQADAELMHHSYPCGLCCCGKPLLRLYVTGKKKKLHHILIRAAVSATYLVARAAVQYVLMLHFCPCREVCNEGPGEPSPRGEHHSAVGRDRSSHLLHPARGHQQKHGEREGFGRHGRHREAGQHHQD